MRLVLFCGLNIGAKQLENFPVGNAIGDITEFLQTGIRNGLLRSFKNGFVIRVRAHVSNRNGELGFARNAKFVCGVNTNFVLT